MLHNKNNPSQANKKLRLLPNLSYHKFYFFNSFTYYFSYKKVQEKLIYLEPF